MASGTSSKCDGNILAVDKDLGFDSQMALKSQQLVHELSNELEIPFEYRNPGSVLVCKNDTEMEAAQKWDTLKYQASLLYMLSADLSQEMHQ